MLRVCCAAVAATAVALTPHAARADGPPPEAIQVFCQPGSLNNCFAFGYETGANGHVTFWVQNLQGSILEGGDWFNTRFFEVQNALDSHLLGAPVVRYLPAQPDGSPAPFPQCLHVATTEGAVRTGTNTCLSEDSNVLSHLQRVYTLDSGGGLMGCAAPPPNLGSNFLAQTCLPMGLDGWLRFDALLSFMDATGRYVPGGTFEDLFVGIDGCQVYAGPRSGYTITNGCATNLSYADIRSRFVTVTPEPASMALLGSGLLGTGVVRRIRRKRADS